MCMTEQVPGPQRVKIVGRHIASAPYWETCISLSIFQIWHFGDHPPGSIFHPLQCVSYLKVICAHSWEHIEAYGDLFRPKLRPVTPLFLMPNEKKHPVFPHTSINSSVLLSKLSVHLALFILATEVPLTMTGTQSLLCLLQSPFCHSCPQ